MIRPVTKEDRETVLVLLDEFYHSPAVLHPVPAEYFALTFDEATGGNPFLELFLIEREGRAAGYGQVSLTWSTEAGGMVVLLEELYIRPAFQGKGIGTEYFAFIDARYAGRAARFRMEVEPDNAGAIKLYTRLGYRELPYLQMCRELGMQG